jgi:hypothetical protein
MLTGNDEDVGEWAALKVMLSNCAYTLAASDRPSVL